MKKKLLALIAIAGACVTAIATPLTQWVDPFIGTSEHGHVFLGANVPFGLIQLGPEQQSHGWDWCSGYHWSGDSIEGFSHMHLSGTGCADLGDILLTPVVTNKPCGALHKAENTGEEELLLPYSHAAEACRPGYYAVTLTDPAVHVELTATQRTGMHRYTFLRDADHAQLILNLRHANGSFFRGGEARQVNDSTIVGYKKTHGWASLREIHFALVCSQSVTLSAQAPHYGQRDGIYAIVPADASLPLTVKVALSAVSDDNALLNLRQELPGWDFDATVRAADAAWEHELGKIRIDADSTTCRTFYTAMYHHAVAPSVYSDVNGDYRGADAQVHHSPDGARIYTTLSLWDTYRSQHPLMTLINHDMQRDLANTFISIYREQGELPVWHLMGNETYCMPGSSAVPVLADLVLKGLVDDEQTAYEAMRASMLRDNRELNFVKQYGCIPYDKTNAGETVAKDLEYGLDFGGLARVAKRLGKQDDYTYFLERSKMYQKHFDKKTQFVRAVASDGTFLPQFDPFKEIVDGLKHYTEGNAWQYTWLVPHDVPGLVKVFGGKKAFVRKLDQLFTVQGDMGENADPDITGLIGQYAHGNEPSHHIIYLYNYVGMPWKAAPLLRHTMRTLYHTGVDGLSGNEDVGQMSAWYILSAVGLYQVNPSGGPFVIGSPVVSQAVLQVGDGRTFTVTAHGNSDTNIYVQRATLNGRPLNRSYLTYDEITAGGVLDLYMGPAPSAWASQSITD